MNRTIGLLGLALLLTAGCAKSVMTPSKLVASESSVRGADVAGANEEPRAALHLKLAQDQLAEAKNLSKNGDGEAADRMLGRADADAELAIALAKQAEAVQAARLAAEDVQKAKQGDIK